MKKFRFRLEPLLKVKEFREKQKQQELAAALGRVTRQQAEVRLADENRRRLTDAQLVKMSRRFTVSDMLVYSRYLVRLKRDALAGREVLHALRKEADKRRRVLAEATKQRRVFDNLKQRKLTAFHEENRLADRKEADEIATSNHRLKSRGD
jgi:flagellar FliJ protein